MQPHPAETKATAAADADAAEYDAQANMHDCAPPIPRGMLIWPPRCEQVDMEKCQETSGVVIRKAIALCHRSLAGDHPNLTAAMSKQSFDFRSAKERETETETETERQRETERDRDRQTDRQRQIERERGG